MKRILLSAFVLLTFFAVQAQPITTTDSLRKAINKYVGNSPVTAFQQMRMNHILYSMANLIDSAYLNGGGGGSGTPGGVDTYVQFNDGGAFGGDAGLLYNKTLNRLTSDTLAALSGRFRTVEFPNLNTRLIRVHNVNADTSVIGTRPYGEFNWTQSEALVNADGQRDVVNHIGYNNDGVGGRRNTNEAAFWLSWESHYIPFPGAQPQFEFFLQSVAKNGAVNRHIALDINKNTGISTGYFRSAGWTFFGDNTNDYYFSVGNGGVDVNNFTPGGNSMFRMYNDNGVGLFFINSTPGQTIISNSGASMADMTLTTSRYLTLSNQIIFNNAADAYTGGNVTFDLPTQNLNKAFTFRDFGQDAILTLRDSIGVTQHIVEVNGRMRIAALGNGTGDQGAYFDAYGNLKGTGLPPGSGSGGMGLINPIVEDSLLHVYNDSTLLVKAPIDGPGYTVASTDTTFQILLSGNFVTPYDYDAINDSTVDNSAAFTALWSNIGKKPIYIPPGVWTIPNTRLTFPQRGGYVFGAGMGTTVLRTNYINNTGGTPLSNIDGFLYGDTSMNNTTIRDLTIRHYGSSASKYVNQALIVAYMGANYDANPSGFYMIENLNLINLKFEARNVSFHAIKLFAFRSGKGGYLRRVTGENLVGDGLGSNFLDLSSGGSGNHIDSKWLSDINFRRVTASKLGLVGDYGFGATVEVCDRCLLDGWNVDSAKNIAFEFIKTKNSGLINSTIKNSQASTLAIAFNGFASHLGDENFVDHVIVSDTNSLGIQVQDQNYFKMSNSSFTSNGLIKISNVQNSSFTNNIYDHRGAIGHTVVSVEGGSKNNIWTGETVRGDSATAGAFSTGIAFANSGTTGNLWNGVNIRYGSGGGAPVTETAPAAGNNVVNYSVNGTRFNFSGTWSETARLQKVGAYYIWFDASGRLRFKASVPTSDTDGTVLVPIPAGGATDEVLAKSSGSDYALKWKTDATGGGGGLTNFSFTDGNGFDGTVTNPTTTPTLSLAPTFTGMVKSNGTAFLAAVPGTDYAAGSHNHAGADINSGTLPDARIQQTGVTQHQAALTIAQSQVTSLTGDLALKAPLASPTFTGTVTAPGITLTSFVNLSTQLVGDANTTITATYVRLGTQLTANRVLTFPAGVDGREVIVFNQNSITNTANTWTTNLNFRRADIANSNVLLNQTVYRFVYDGGLAQWVVVN